MDQRLKARPRWGVTGIELACGHTVWGGTGENDFGIWLAEKYQNDLWCVVCISSSSVTGFWRPRG